MQKQLVLLMLLLCAKGAISQNKITSVEASADVSAVWFPSLDGIDRQLTRFGHPELAGKFNVLQGSATRIKVLFNKLGIFYESNFAYIRTSADINKHYYYGPIYGSVLGMSYEILKSNTFILSPYFSLGFNQANIFLDYEFEQGVTPTSLNITGDDGVFTGGIDAYVKIRSWKEDRLQFFIKGGASYSYAVDRVWRFDNMLVNSYDFNTSAINANGGLVIRYTFNK